MEPPLASTTMTAEAVPTAEVARRAEAVAPEGEATNSLRLAELRFRQVRVAPLDWDPDRDRAFDLYVQIAPPPLLVMRVGVRAAGGGATERMATDHRAECR